MCYTRGKVTEETIVNCWKKCNILNSIDSIQNLKIIDSTSILSDIDYKLNFLSLSRFKYTSTCNTETFISNYFLDSTETSEDISISEI